MSFVTPIIIYVIAFSLAVNDTTYFLNILLHVSW